MENQLNITITKDKIKVDGQDDNGLKMEYTRDFDGTIDDFHDIIPAVAEFFKAILKLPK